MRPSYTLSTGHQLREITLWKAIVLSIITFGIYYLILVYQNTKDLQATRAQPFEAWQVVFWIGVIPFLGFLHFILYAFNFMGLRELRQRSKQDDDALAIVALVLAIVLAPVGQIIWAIHFNETARVASQGTIAPLESAST